MKKIMFLTIILLITTPSFALNHAGRPLTVMAMGNSIGNYNGYTTTPKNGMEYRSEIAFALSLAGPQFSWRYAGTAVASKTDKYGNYGYASQTLPTILTDLDSTWFPQLAATGVNPDVLVGIALVENDIAAGSGYQTIKNAIDGWVNLMRNKFPGIMLMICTPHPDSRFDTAVEKQVFFAVRAHILSLDNGIDIFVSDLSGDGSYADPADLSQGLPYYGWLTTEGTDTTGVHPTEVGAHVNGRILAKAFNRISTKLDAVDLKVLSSNLLLTGASNVASPAGFSGTAPTGGSFPTALTNGGTCVSTSTNPGKWNLVCNVPSTLDTVIARMSFTTNLPVGNVQTYAKVRINSGAKAIRNVHSQMQFSYTGASPANEQYLSQNFNTTAATAVYGFPSFPGLPSYEDGDILYLISPPLMPSTSGNALATVFHDVDIVPAYDRAVINVDILATGVIDLGNTGKIGEMQQSTVASGAAVSLTTATAANVTSKSLEAGWWKISGVVDYALSGTTATNFTSGINTTSATLPTQAGTQAISSDPLISVPLGTTTLTDTYSQVIPPVLVKLTATTTVYLVARATFSAGTTTAYGTLRAERVQLDGTR